MKWEVETAVNMKDREGQIQLTAGVTLTQEQLIPQLEQENIELRGLLGAVKHEREEILQKTSFAIKEVEVLTSQFAELQGEMERLRQVTPEPDDVCGKEMANLISSTKSLRLSASSSREEVCYAMKKLEDMRKEEED